MFTTDPMHKKLALVHMVVCCRADAKTFSEPMMAKFIDACVSEYVIQTHEKAHY